MITGIVLLESVSEHPEEWHALRKIGSSDASAIVGLNPWRTPYRAWLELSELIENEPENEAMYWGKRLEEVVANEFMIRSGFAVLACDRLYEHPVHKFMTASPDRLVVDGQDELGLLECKTSGAFSDHDWSTGVNDHAHIQVQHQLAVTGLPFAYIAVLVGGRDFYWYRVERDEEIIARLIEMETQFWQLVESHTPPAMRGEDGALLAKLYPVSTIDTRILPDEADAVAARIRDYKKIIKSAELQLERDETTLKAMLQDAGRGETARFEVLWPSYPRTAWDVKRLEEAHPELAEEFKTTKPVRRFSVKEKADGKK